ncbi:unnamed protein product [Phaeothamnion confervicola]
MDAKIYGAYWCSHCEHQARHAKREGKEMFGAEAFEKYITYIECSRQGVDNQADLCRAKDVPGYPTWEIKGKLFPGEKTLEEIEEIVASLK